MRVLGFTWPDIQQELAADTIDGILAYRSQTVAAGVKVATDAVLADNVCHCHPPIGRIAGDRFGRAFHVDANRHDDVGGSGRKVELRGEWMA